MWAALSGERTTPHTSVDLDFVFGDAHVGREVLPNLYLEEADSGVWHWTFTRRLTQTARAVRPGTGTLSSGLTYRRQLGRKSGGFSSMVMEEDLAWVLTSTWLERGEQSGSLPATSA